MIISRLWKTLDEDKKNALDWGLGWGLVGSLVGSLVGGLGWSLVGSLVWGLVVLLVNWKEAFPFLMQFYPVALLIFGIIVLSEILFWLMPEEKIKKEKVFAHTLKRKLENIFEVLMGLSTLAQIYIFGREIQVKEYLPEIIKWIGYIGAGIIILGAAVGLFYLWIKLNSLKYSTTIRR